MPALLVQSDATNGNGTDPTLAFSGALTNPSELLIIGYADTAIVGVSDSGSHVWTERATANNAGGTIKAWTAPNTSTTAPTVTFDTGTGFYDLFVGEVTGGTFGSAIAAAEGPSGISFDSGDTAGASAADSLAVGACIGYAVDPTLTAPPTQVEELFFSPGTSLAGKMATGVLAAAAVATCEGTVAGESYRLSVAILFNAGGGAAPVGLTADQTPLATLFVRHRRQLPVWQGSWGGPAFTSATGTADGSFGGTFTAVGTPNTLGVAVASFGFTATAAGVPRTSGVAVTSFGGTFTALGVDRAIGVAVATFGFTATALGVAGTPPVTGQAAATFGFTGTAAGVPRTSGAATATFGGTFTGLGVDRALGQAAATFGYTATAAGVDRAVGQAAAFFGYTGTASGVPRTRGVAVAAFGFTATATGFAGTPPETGQATAVFAGTFTALGVDRAIGVAVAAFGFTATGSGHQRNTGTATGTFGYTATALGRPRVHGQATATFGFTAAIFIITYQVKLVAVGGNRYSAVAASSNTSSPGVGRYSSSSSNRFTGAAGGPRYNVED